MKEPMTRHQIMELAWKIRRAHSKSEYKRLVAGAPALYCPVCKQPSWCEHNGGVLGPGGYEAPPKDTT